MAFSRDRGVGAIGRTIRTCCASHTAQRKAATGLPSSSAIRGSRPDRFPLPPLRRRGAAAADLLREDKDRFAWKIGGAEQRALTLVLDGENVWGAYRQDGGRFLGALYRLLERDPDIRTVTFGEFLRGNGERGVEPYRIDGLFPVHDLFNGSWIDENGSAPGVDLGT